MTTSLTDEEIQRMRTARHLLPPPGDEVVGHLLNEVERMKAEVAGLVEQRDYLWPFKDEAIEGRTKIARLKKANEQTIEVLEGFEKLGALPELPLPRIVIAWWRAKAKPLLADLKALQDGGE